MTKSKDCTQEIYIAHDAFRCARAAYDLVPGEAPELDHSAAGRAKDKALHDFMLTPARIEWAVAEKFLQFEAVVMDPDTYNGPSEGPLWLAAMKRDALWLADGWNTAIREIETLERDLARIRAIWRDVSHPEAEDAMEEMDARR